MCQESPECPDWGSTAPQSPSAQGGWGEESAARGGWRNLSDLGGDASGNWKGKPKDRMRLMNERWKTAKSPEWVEKKKATVEYMGYSRKDEQLLSLSGQGTRQPMTKFLAQLCYILHILWTSNAVSSLIVVRLMLKDPKNPETVLAHGFHSRILWCWR